MFYRPTAVDPVIPDRSLNILIPPRRMFDSTLDVPYMS